ncbi:PREDICTED: protein SSUH2 homolog [Cyprinodon variegatus]|uniref:protein SSUH2 homolog n=1 Tax=Cyprinodon variegatus TaxID=28743 RepID=UPI000742B1F4|nr:PREDICTED: protein SSUH2 homolog [Cyprinodon variegatus]
MDEMDEDLEKFDPNIPEEGPSAPPPGWLEDIHGYQGNNKGGPEDEEPLYPPPPAYNPQPELNRSTSVPNIRVPSVSEDVAREALLKFVESKWKYSSKPARNLTFKTLKPITVYRYRLETYTETRTSAWQFEPYNGKPSQQTRIYLPFSSKRCTFCHGHGRARNKRCTRCHGRGRKRCLSCRGDGYKTCSVCHGAQNLLHFIQLTVTWKNNVSNFIPDRQPDFPDKKFEKVSGDPFFIDENVLVYPIVGFPDQEICDVSTKLINEHLCRFTSTSRILQQRQTIELVPLTHALYWYSGKDYGFYVYGVENKVFTSKYPTSCSIL